MKKGTLGAMDQNDVLPTNHGIPRFGYYTVAGLALVALLPLSGAYYLGLRWVLFLFSGWMIWLSVNAKAGFKKIGIWAVIAILFNPIEMVVLGKPMWMVIDLIIAGLFIWMGKKAEA